MKIIFSRKVFDTYSGGFPNPIFENNRIFSIPIPDKKTSFKYSDIKDTYKEIPITEILNDITGKRIRSGKKLYKEFNYSKTDFRAHNDPFFYKGQSIEGYFFGQQGNVQSELRNRDVTKGDVFLFFGIFQRVNSKRKKWIYDKNFPPCHVIFGWMQIGEVVDLTDNKNVEKLLRKYLFLKEHPHIECKEFYKNNTIYIPSYKLIIDGKPVYNKGSGKFLFKESRILNNSNTPKLTEWKLPYYLSDEKAFLNKRLKFKTTNDKYCILKVQRGQEYIYDLDKLSTKNKNKVLDYLLKLICENN